jgi:SprA-related family
MQTVSQSYSTQIYSQVQRGASLFPVSKDTETSTKPHSSDEPHSSSYQDSLSLSPAGKEIAKQQKSATTGQEKGTDQKPLTDEELSKLTELKLRDTEVRTHEQAHLSTAGAYAAGGASFSYTTGPNGKRYATGGEVPIDMAKEDSPAATILKMQTVRRAALAPANPSSADRAIAAQASAKELQAKKELQAQEVPAVPTVSTQETDLDDNTIQQDRQLSPEISDYSRKSMTSAYQAMASLAP